MDRGELVAQIYDVYQSLMYQVAYGILRDSFLAEDTVHECVIRLMKANALAVDSIMAASTKSLVRIVATNESIRQYHKHQKIRSHTDPLEENQYYIAANLGFRVEMEDFLNNIPRIYRDMAVLRAYYGYEYAVIGKLLGIRPQTAKNRMVKLRKLIKKCWIGGDPIEEGGDREKDRCKALQFHGK